MKRLTLWLAVSLTTFTLGVTASVLYLYRSASNSVVPSAVKHDAPAAPSCFPGLSRSIEKLSTSSYFPRGAFYPEPEREKFTVEWYSNQLKAMGESSLLSQPDSPPETYRFLWLRSFRHPVAVRVWASCYGHFISVKQLSSQGTIEPGRLITDQTRPLTDTEWDHFINLLDRSCYWQLGPETDDIGFDGARWVLEGVREGRYHLVDRWTPESGDYQEACLYLLKLSNPAIDLSKEDIY